MLPLLILGVLVAFAASAKGKVAVPASSAGTATLPPCVFDEGMPFAVSQAVTYVLSQVTDEDKLRKIAKGLDLFPLARACVEAKANAIALEKSTGKRRAPSEWERAAGRLPDEMSIPEGVFTVQNRSR